MINCRDIFHNWVIQVSILWFNYVILDSKGFEFERNQFDLQVVLILFNIKTTEEDQ